MRWVLEQTTLTYIYIYIYIYIWIKLTTSALYIYIADVVSSREYIYIYIYICVCVCVCIADVVGFRAYIYICSKTHHISYTTRKATNFKSYCDTVFHHLLPACQERRHQQGLWLKSWRKMSAQNMERWIRITVVCDVTPCSLVKWVDFTGYPVTSNFWEEDIIQRMEAAGPLETWFRIYKTKMRRIQECTHRHRDRRQNHKSRQQSALGDVKEHVQDGSSVFFGGMYYCSRTS